MGVSVPYSGVNSRQTVRATGKCSSFGPCGSSGVGRKPRYTMAQKEAEDELAELINYENTFGEGNTNDRIRTTDETRSNFRWGKS